MFTEFPSVKAIMGTSNIENIVNAVHWVLNYKEHKSFLNENKGYIAKHNTPRIRLSNGVSAYIKISEGCNHRCSFCIIPSLRGTMKSREIDDILEEAKDLEKSGAQEVILVGQDTSAYGIDLYKGQRRLAELLEKLATKTKLPWIRFMYAYPSELSAEMLQVIAQYDNLVKYIDIPLQHAHPDILELMNRPAGAQQTIDMIREYIPEAAIRTSFIVGHPGETEVEFDYLLNFIKNNKFDRVGVFPYSSEDGTLSATLPGEVSKNIKNERQSLILEAQKKISLEKNENLIGKTEKVLIERIIDNKLYGRTFRDAPEIDGHVIINPQEKEKTILENHLGEFVDVTFTEAKNYELIGEMKI